MTTTETKTKHKQDCKMAFGRKDSSCPRCQELLNGAAPVRWNISKSKQDDMDRVAAIRAHVCTLEKCGPVCTRFEW